MFLTSTTTVDDKELCKMIDMMNSSPARGRQILESITGRNNDLAPINTNGSPARRRPTQHPNANNSGTRPGSTGTPFR